MPRDPARRLMGAHHPTLDPIQRQAILIEDVEHLIEDYTRVQITPARQEALSGMLHHEFDRLMATETDELNRLTTNRRLCNQAFFTKIYIDEDDQLRVENAPSRCSSTPRSTPTPSPGPAQQQGPNRNHRRW